MDGDQSPIGQFPQSSNRANNKNMRLMNKINHGLCMAYAVICGGIGGIVGPGNAIGADGLPASVIAWGQWCPPVPVFSSEVVAVSAGGSHNVALLKDGTVADWGSTIKPPQGLSGVAAIAAGNGHGLALQTNGTVVAWGDNSAGQCQVPGPFDDFIAISAAANHSAGLRRNGQVVCWGANVYGESTVPDSLTNAIAIACGDYFSMALLKGGSVVAWGGQWGLPGGETNLNITAIAAGTLHWVGLLADGTVIARGGNGMGGATVPPGLSNVVAVAAGAEHSIALTREGTVIGWGWDLYGQATGPVGMTHVRAIAARGNANLAVLSRAGFDRQPESQTVFAGDTVVLNSVVYGFPAPTRQWLFDGFPMQTSAGDVLVLTNIQASGAGDYSLIVKNDYGAVTSGVVTITVTLSAPGFKAPLADQTVAEGENVMFDPQSFGSSPLRYQWYWNGNLLQSETNAILRLAHVTEANSGQYGITIRNPFGGSTSSTATLRIGRFGPKLLTQPEDQNVSAGSTASFFADVAGSKPLIFQWSKNGEDIAGATNATLILSNVPPTHADPPRYAVSVFNSLGYVFSKPALLRARIPGAPIIWGNTVAQPVPSSFSNVVSISASGNYMLGLTTDGKVVAMGAGDQGQTMIPEDLSDVVDISAGSGHVLALKKNGTVVTWGGLGFANYFQIMNIPKTVSDIVAVSAGGGHSLVLKRDGTVIAWGGNYLNQSDVPSYLRDVVSITAIGSSSFAVRKDGSVVAWGANNYGEIPSTLRDTAQIGAGLGGAIFALGKDGSLVSWGNNQYNLLYPQPRPTNVVELTFGGFRTAAAMSLDGSLATWGDKTSGQLFPPTALRDVLSVSFCDAFAAALTRQPVFSSQPLSWQSCNSGNPFTLDVRVISDTPVTYQWQKENVDLPGATNATLEWSDIRTNHAGQYSVTASNQFGVTHSEVFTLVVYAANPYVVVFPYSTSLPAGTNATFTSYGYGLPDLQYQWYFGETIIPGATQSNLFVENLQVTNTGNYTLVATDGNGVAQSMGSLHVYGPPLFIAPPISVAIPAATNAQLVAYTAGYVSGYQWYLGSQTIAGATRDSVTLSNLQSAMAGDYFVVATNSYGATTGLVAHVSVIPTSPAITSQPANQSVAANAPARFKVSAAGSEPFRYQWQFNGTDLVGATQAVLTLPHVQIGDEGQYGVKVENEAGTAQAIPATLQVTGGPPAIAGNPLRTVAVLGDSARLEVNATGNAPLFYQWRRDGIALEGATNITLVVTNVTVKDEAAYSVVVSNALGSATSLSANLIVIVPGAVVGWGNIVVPPGLDDVVDVAAGGTHALALKKDGTVVAWGANQAGQASVPAGLSNVVKIAAGYRQSLALKVDGTVVGWGQGQQNILPAGLSNVIGIACGSDISLALLQNGDVVSWGIPPNSPVQVPAGLEDVTAISAGSIHAAALLRNGRVVSWGYNYGQTNTASLTNIVEIAAGSQHNLALKADGTIIGVGGNSYGELQPPAEATNLVSIAAAQQFSAAIRKDGKVFVWGRNASAQKNVPATALNAEGLAAGGDFNYGYFCLALVRNPVFIAQPTNQTVLLGSTVVFHGEAAGASELGYQWHFNAKPISGETNATLALSNIQPAQAGNYSVTVSNRFNSIISTQAVLAVQSAPRFLNQPPHQAIMAGGTATFTAGVTGSTPLSYQWQFNGVDLPGANLSKLVVTNVQPSSAGVYRLSVSNQFGWVQSDWASLVVAATMPQEMKIPVDGSIAFNAATVTNQLTRYQWLLDGEPIQDATNKTLLLTHVTFDAGGVYSIVLSNATLVVTNKSTDLIVQPSAPLITGQPTGIITVVDSGFCLQVSATGSAPLCYQWRLDGVEIPQATNNSLPLPHMQPSVAGGYSVTVSNDFGAVTSVVAAVVVIIPPSVTIQPTNQALAAGFDATFQAVVEGTPPFAYQWYRNGTKLASKTNATLALTNLTTSQTDDYTVGVSNRAGATMSLPAHLDVFVQHPSVVGQPVGRAVLIGTNVTLSVVGMGSPPLVYQWFFNGSVIPGEIGTNLVLTNVRDANAGAYTVRISNNYGSIESDPASIVVNTPAGLANFPASQSLPAGMTARFSAVASGTPPLHYQWQFNGDNLLSATTTNLVLTNIQNINAGRYTVIVSNDFGSAISESAELIVQVAKPTIIQHPMDRNAILDGSSRFVTAASGSEPFTYQWRFHGSDLPGETNAVLNLSHLKLSDADDYTVVVSNAYGSDSALGHLTVIPPTVLVAWGDTVGWQTNAPADLTNAVAIASGFEHCLALRSDGSVVAWGKYTNQATQVPQGISNVVAISANGNRNLVLLEDGSMAGWWDEMYAKSTVPSGVPPATAIAAGLNHSLCMLNDGSIYGWEVNIEGDLETPVGLDRVKKVIAGENQSLAITGDNALYAWGRVSAVLTGHKFIGAWSAGPVSLALTEEGTLVSLGSNEYGQRDIPSGLNEVVQATVGFNSAAALRKDGTVICWGSNDYGQTNVPGGLTNVWAIAAGTRYMLALASEPVHITVPLPPLISQQPSSQSVWANGSVLFRAEATGVGPLAWQWQFNGTNLAGQTANTLRFDAVQLSQDGVYSVVVSNIAGFARSQSAFLTVLNGSVMPAAIGNPSTNPAGGVSLQLMVEPGYDYSLQASDDLVHWSHLTRFFGTGPVVPINDPAATNSSKRFYRVVSP